jgi:hypothetical protein
VAPTAAAAANAAAARGRAVQVDSIKPRIDSAPGVCNQRLKLKYGEPLSNVAFKFNPAATSWRSVELERGCLPGRAVQVDRFKTRVESTCVFSA